MENQCISLPFRMCAITSTGLKWRVFRIPVSAPWCSYQPIESPFGRSIEGNCDIWYKLHEGLTGDESVDVGEGKFKILISSPESLSEKKKYGISYYYYCVCESWLLQNVGFYLFLSFVLCLKNFLQVFPVSIFQVLNSIRGNISCFAVLEVKSVKPKMSRST